VFCSRALGKVMGEESGENYTLRSFMNLTPYQILLRW
jgi:hypothetical protein